MKQSLRRSGIFGVLALPLVACVLLLAACTPTGFLAVGTAAPTEIPTLTPSSPDTRVPPTTLATPTPLPSPTARLTGPTPEPTPSPPVCTSWQQIDTVFVSDLDLPDDVHLPPHTSFRKSWRLRNTGECAWPPGMQLAHIAGSLLPGSQVLDITSAAPGEEADLSVIFLTPGRLGQYQSFWRLRFPNGPLVGTVIFTRFVVDAMAEYQQGELPDLPPPATETPIPPVTPEAAPTALPPTVAVVPATPTPAPTVTPRGTFTPAPSLTATTIPLTPTPRATLTATPSPAATAIPPTPTPSEDDCRLPDTRFLQVLEAAMVLELKSLCTLGAVREETGFLQRYWPGPLVSRAAEGAVDEGILPTPTATPSLVILSSPTGKVTILGRGDLVSPTHTFAVYQSDWRPAMPERSPTCAILVSPAGAVFPTHAIGQVWCAESLWLTIGWPMASPIAVQIATQAIPDGLLMEVRSEEAHYVVAVNMEQRRSVVHELP
jgi:hypothetical protein